MVSVLPRVRKYFDPFVIISPLPGKMVNEYWLPFAWPWMANLTILLSSRYRIKPFFDPLQIKNYSERGLVNSKVFLHKVIFLFPVLLLITGCAFQPDPSAKLVGAEEADIETIAAKTVQVDIPSVNVNSMKDPSLQALAQVLFEQYLIAYQDKPTDPQTKLLSHRIEKVDIPEAWQSCAELRNAKFIAAITFSVKPERWPPPRWASDGTLTDDHWITGKRASIAVFQSGQDYKMELLGVPICPGY